MNKQNLIQQILSELSQKLDLLTQSALAAHQAATHEDSKAENKYDTRGLEASYLAGAQAERAAQIREMITFYKLIVLKSFTPDTPIAATALVKVECEGKQSFYFIVPQGGGLHLKCDGKEVLVIGSESPLGEELLGRKPGDVFEVKTKAGLREYEIVEVF